MAEFAIRCAGLSKQYRIGPRESYKALRDTLTEAMYAPFRRIRSASSKKPPSRNGNTFWAVDDVSFDVKPGEVVGLIGGNGAGKSTLLKLLSRITEPTKGSAEIRGRIGSLLEVGTGFNPELTGRENTYLNGAILGMKKVELDRKFDEIVAFAEVEKFLDTPVKHYSSGMYMRLAFAVAVHLEPEILLIDEVLAVGDAQFQKKCFAKMREIGRGGRTILFVSHNMSAVRSICSRGLVLDAGRLVDQGDINETVDKYLASTSQKRGNHRTIETESFLVHDVSIRSTNGPVIKTFDPVEIKVRFTPKVDILDPSVSLGILTLENFRLIGLEFKDFKTIPTIRAGQQSELGFLLEGLPLLHGTYRLEVQLNDITANRVEMLPDVFPFDVVETPVYGGRKIDGWFGLIGLKARPLSHVAVSDEGPDEGEDMAGMLFRRSRVTASINHGAQIDTSRTRPLKGGNRARRVEG